MFHKFSRWFCVAEGTPPDGVNAGTHLRDPRLSTPGPAPHTCMLLACGDEVGQGAMGAEGTRKSGAAGGQKLGDIYGEERGRGGGREVRSSNPHRKDLFVVFCGSIQILRLFVPVPLKMP